MLKNKTAIVTGSSKGLGREIAICLAKNGANIGIHYNKSYKSANELKGEIESLGSKTLLLKADLTKPEDAKNMFSVTYKKFKRIDILVNNVGNFLFKDIDKVSFEEWKYILDTTLNSTFLCCKECLPYMMKNKCGRIINIGDASADKVTANIKRTPYIIGKVGVLILTKSLALSYAKHNITVNMVSPGIMENSTFKPSLEEIPIGRYGKFREITNTIMFLLSNNEDYITGTNILVSGGWKL